MNTSFITSHLYPFPSLPLLSPLSGFPSFPLHPITTLIELHIYLLPHVQHWLTSSAHPIQDGSYRRRQTTMLQPTFLRHLPALRTPPKNGQIPLTSARIISPNHQDDHSTPVISLALSPDF